MNQYELLLLQVRDSAQSFLTVQVPLYVSYIYITAPRGWASLEHHTEMDFSFFYDTVLWRTGRTFQSVFKCLSWGVTTKADKTPPPLCL